MTVAEVRRKLIKVLLGGVQWASSVVAGKEKFVRRGGSRGKERGEFVKKTGKGFRK